MHYADKSQYNAGRTINTMSFDAHLLMHIHEIAYWLIEQMQPQFRKSYFLSCMKGYLFKIAWKKWIIFFIIIQYTEIHIKYRGVFRGPCAYLPLWGEKIGVNFLFLMWKNCAKIWTLLKMYTWNVPSGHPPPFRFLITPLIKYNTSRNSVR